MLWRPPAVIIVYQKFRQVAPTSLFITYTLHPLPDRDRSRIASGLSVQRLPPVAVTLLLILRVTVSGDTRNVLEQREGFEPPALRICNPLHWTTLPPLHYFYIICYLL